MANPTIRIYDAETDQVIDREMNAAELKVYQADQAAAEAFNKALADREAAKVALLAKLGITAEEAALLANN